MINKTILVIDDDDILRRGLVRGLHNAGFNTIASESADNANEVLSKIIPDLIILDRMMTGQDGLSFLLNLRKHDNRTPVIMLTAMTGPENTIDGLAGGADDYLAKPFQFQELVLRINNLLKHRITPTTRMPDGLILSNGDFFIETQNGRQLLALSGEENKLLQSLTSPMGCTATATPMVAKRLRLKLNSVLSNLDIVTIRGHGYKLIDTNKQG